MSRPQRLRASLRDLVGRRVPGGCPDCDAYQVMAEEDGVFLLAVHHDDTCPSYRQMIRPEGATP